MEVVAIILAISLLASVIFNFKLISKIDFLSKNSNKIKSKLNQLEDTISMDIGDRAMYKISLVSTDKTTGDRTNFTVCYELEILEVGLNNIKVKAVDFTSQDSYANDPLNKSHILDYMSNQWILKKEVDLLIDDSDRRNSKIEKILTE